MTLGDDFPAWRHRGYLPHLEISGGIYFVTFRLADSMPRAIRDAWENERTNVAAEAADRVRPSSDDEKRKQRELFSERVEKYLDAGAGACWLLRGEVATIVAGSLRHFDGIRYRLFAWVVMPNHVHVVFRPNDGFGLKAITHAWKSFTANEANRLLDRRGEAFWQKESYDHLVRDEEDLEHCVRYTLDNPVKAGLCARPEDWRWSSAWGGESDR